MEKLACCPICREEDVWAGYQLGDCFVCLGCRFEFFTRRVLAFLFDAMLVIILIGGVGALISLFSFIHHFYQYLPMRGAELLAALYPFKESYYGVFIGGLRYKLRVVDFDTARSAGLGQLVMRHSVGLGVYVALYFLYLNTGKSVMVWWVGIGSYLGVKMLWLFFNERWLGDYVAGTRLMWFEHREKMQLGKCERCSYTVMGNESGACGECGLRVSQRNLAWLKGR